MGASGLPWSLGSLPGEAVWGLLKGYIFAILLEPYSNHGITPAEPPSLRSDCTLRKINRPAAPEAGILNGLFVHREGRYREGVRPPGHTSFVLHTVQSRALQNPGVGGVGLLSQR